MADDLQPQAETLATESDVQHQVTSPDDGQETQAQERSELEVGEPEKPAATEAKQESETQTDDDLPRKESGSARLKRQLAQANARLIELERSRDSSGDINAEVERRLGAPPKESDFQDYSSYDRQLTAYETAKMLARATVQQEMETRKQSAEIARAEIDEEHISRAREAMKRIPDFVDVVSKSNVPINDNLADWIKESEKSADLAYHLAKNPNLAAELNSLPPLQAARQLGRLEASLTIPQPRKATGAPAPNTAVRGGASPERSSSAAIDAFIARKYPGR
jgi:hypothetical protein